MAYPDLPPPDAFWRCPQCGNEGLFRASGTGDIACGACNHSSTREQILAAYAQAHPSAATAAPAH